MIVTVTSFKGGVGKSTTAVHLAAVLAERGPTVLIDGDPNRSASGWASRGGEGALPFRVVPVTQIAKVAREFEHMVIDTEARPNTDDLKELAEGGDVLVLPTSPDAMALEATEQTVQQLQTLGARNYVTLLTIVPPMPSKAGQEAASYLQESGVPVVSSRIPRLTAYQSAALGGVLVRDVKDPNAARAWAAYVDAAGEILP